MAAGANHDLAGEGFQRLSKDVAYLKISAFHAKDIPRYLDSAIGTKGLIIDVRNYPPELVATTLGAVLVDHETPFVCVRLRGRGKPRRVLFRCWSLPRFIPPPRVIRERS